MKTLSSHMIVILIFMLAAPCKCIALPSEKELLSPDGKIRVQLDSRTLQFNDAKDNGMISKIQLLSPLGFRSEIRWKADSKKFLFTNKNGIHVVDVQSGTDKILTGLFPEFGLCSWSPDGKMVAASGAFPEPGKELNCLKIWNSETGQSVASLKDLLARRLAWSPDSKKIALMDREWVIKVFAPDVQKVVTKIQAERAGLPTLAWSPDSKYLAVGKPMNSKVELFDTRNGAFVNTHEFQYCTLITLKWSPDGKSLMGQKDLEGNLWETWTVPYNSDSGEIIKTVRIEPKLGMKEYIPQNLEECFIQLDAALKPEEIKKIASGTEKDLINYHLGLGMSLRNRWGLWSGSRLAKYFNNMGLFHPDDISDLIMTTYWRHKNGKALEVEQEISRYKEYWSKAKDQQSFALEQTKTISTEIAKRMMYLKLLDSPCPVIELAHRTVPGIRVRYAADLGDSILITGGVPFEQTGKTSAPPKFEFVVKCFLYDKKSKKLTSISAKELDTITGAIAINKCIYILGTQGAASAVLKISGKVHTIIPTPPTHEWNMLGVGAECPILVQPTCGYELKNDKWSKLFSTSAELPECAQPPLLANGRLYFRDEGKTGSDKKLFWIDLSAPDNVVSFTDDTALVGSNGPRWEFANSFSAPGDGSLWVSAGTFNQSVIRWTKEKGYMVATFNDNLKFTGSLLGTGRIDPSTPDAIALSCVAASSKDVARCVGESGLFLIDHQTILPEVRFKNTSQVIKLPTGQLYYRWTPTHILQLAQDCYFIGGHWGGCYLLNKDSKGTWTIESIDDAQIEEKAI